METLKLVRDLLSDHNRWTKDCHARLDDHGETDPRDPNATCWCLAGALVKVIDVPTDTADDNPDFQTVSGTLTAASKELFPDRVFENGYVDFNDDPDTNHDDLMLVIEKAINS